MKFISTAGHGFLSVTPNQLKTAMKKGFKPTSFSFMSKSQVLLEEDCDLSGFMVAMYGEDRQEKMKSIKDTYQNDINRTKYMSVPETLEEFEAKLEIMSINRKFIGMTMVTIDGEKHEVLRTQSNGYIYNDGTLYNMPLYRIDRMIETV